MEIKLHSFFGPIFIWIHYIDKIFNVQLIKCFVFFPSCKYTQQHTKLEKAQRRSSKQLLMTNIQQTRSNNNIYLESCLWQPMSQNLF